MTVEEMADTLIIIFIAETDPDSVFQISSDVQKQFHKVAALHHAILTPIPSPTPGPRQHSHHQSDQHPDQHPDGDDLVEDVELLPCGKLLVADCAREAPQMEHLAIMIVIRTLSAILWSHET